MPRDIIYSLWFLDPEMDTPTQDVRADQIFDRIENLGVPN
jgi:hypothetical protein